jgi:hypothetical protein
MGVSVMAQTMIINKFKTAFADGDMASMSLPFRFFTGKRPCEPDFCTGLP